MSYRYFHHTTSLLNLLHDEATCSAKKLDADIVNTVNHAAILMVRAEFAYNIAETLYQTFRHEILVNDSADDFCHRNQCLSVNLCGRLAKKLDKNKVNKVFDNNSKIDDIVLSSMLFHLVTPDLENITKLAKIMFSDPAINRQEPNRQQRILKAIENWGNTRLPESVLELSQQLPKLFHETRALSSETSNQSNQQLGGVLSQLVHIADEFVHGKKRTLQIAKCHSTEFCRLFKYVTTELVESLKAIPAEGVNETKEASVNNNNTEEAARIAFENSSDNLAVMACRISESGDTSSLKQYCSDVSAEIDNFQNMARAFIIKLNLKNKSSTVQKKKRKSQKSTDEKISDTIYKVSLLLNPLQQTNGHSSFCNSRSAAKVAKQWSLLALKFSTVKYGLNFEKNKNNEKSFTTNGFETSRVDNLLKLCNEAVGFFNSILPTSRETAEFPQSQIGSMTETSCTSAARFFQQNYDTSRFHIKFGNHNHHVNCSMFFAAVQMAFGSYESAFVEIIREIYNRVVSTRLTNAQSDLAIKVLDSKILTSKQWAKLEKQPPENYVRDVAHHYLSPPTIEKALESLKVLFHVNDETSNTNCAKLREALNEWKNEKTVDFIESSLTKDKKSTELDSNSKCLYYLLCVRGDIAHGKGLQKTLTINDQLFAHKGFADCIDTILSKVEERSEASEVKDAVAKCKGNLTRVTLKTKTTHFCEIEGQTIECKLLSARKTSRDVPDSAGWRPNYKPESYTQAVVETKGGNRGTSKIPMDVCADGSENYKHNTNPKSLSRKIVKENIVQLSRACGQMEVRGVLTSQLQIDSHLGKCCEDALKIVGEVVRLMQDFINFSESTENNQSSRVTSVAILEGITSMDQIVDWTNKNASRILEILAKDNRNEIISRNHVSTEKCFKFLIEEEGNGENFVKLSYFEVYHLSLRMKAFEVGVSNPSPDDSDAECSSDDSEDGEDQLTMIDDEDDDADDSITGLQVVKMKVFWSFVNYNLEKLGKHTQTHELTHVETNTAKC